MDIKEFLMNCVSNKEKQDDIEKESYIEKIIKELEDFEKKT